jgi:1-acyl-sn-glycerol-3-phosphate acyltransferase
MTVDDFWAGLKHAHGYTTPDQPERTLADRVLWQIDTWYYLRVLAVVWTTSRQLRRTGRPFDQPHWGRQAYAVLRAVEACGGRLTVRGLEHVQALSGPAVYISNHMSMLETLILPVLLVQHRLVTMVVKANLLQYPIFGTIMRACRPIAVGRQDPRADLRTVMERGAEILRNEDRSIIVFPQATRSPRFDPSDFNSLGVKLARAAGVPVVPLALKTDFHGIGKHWRDFGPVDRSKGLFFEFGPAMPVTGNGRDEQRRTVAFIGARLRAWGGEVAEETKADVSR